MCGTEVTGNRSCVSLGDLSSTGFDRFWGMDFHPDNPCALYLMAFDGSDASIVALQVVRDPSGHVVALGSEATPVAAAPGGSALRFFSSDPLLFVDDVDKQIEQVHLPTGDTMAQSFGAIMANDSYSIEVVPAGFDGSGKIKSVSLVSGEWFDLDFVFDTAPVSDFCRR